MILDISNYALAAIMVCVTITWAMLLKSMVDSYCKTPRLVGYEVNGHTPKVSVILPARNEEEHIGRCLDSLAAQDYPDYEIMAINDSSEDATGGIIARHSKADSKIVHVDAAPKPDGWMGKNWACMEGYRQSKGELLLFTDADTKHARNVITLAVAHLLARELDALTVIPRLLCRDFWTRITLPVISTFLHTRFSALRVNDPTKKTGYFFGSFFIIRRDAYEAVGTHEGVRHEIIEDGALGRKLKESGRPMRMVAGDELIDAEWARDLSTLWHALRRLMIPLYIQDRIMAVGAYVAVLFLLFAPFVLLVYSAVLFWFLPSFQALFWASLAASIATYAGAAFETRILHLGLRYALFAPVGGLIIVAGFQSGLFRAKSGATLHWRGRSYSMGEHAQRPVGM